MERGPNRCGNEKAHRTVDAKLGQPIHVPLAPDGQMVVATFDLDLSWWWKTLGVVYKAPQAFIQIDQSGPPHRFIVETARDLHVLRPADTLDYAPSFAPATIRSLTISIDGAMLTNSAVSVHFYTIPLG